MNKPEPIYLPESDAIESFAPEPGGEPRRTARDSFAEPLDVFRSEVFAKTKSSPRTSVPLRTRHRIHPASIVAVAGIAAVFAVVITEQSNAPEPISNAPTASSSVGSRDASPALPPVTAAPPAPSPSIPEPTVGPSQPTAATAENQPPPPLVQPDLTARSATTDRPAAPLRSEPSVRYEPLARSEPPVRSDSTPAASASSAASPRMPKPLSQDPSRLAAGVTTPAGATTPSTSPRDGADVPAARTPSTAANASPAAEAAARPPAATSPAPGPPAPPPSVAAAPTPSPSAPSPSPPAVTPPTAAATASSTPAPSATVARPPAPAAAPPAAAAAVIDRNTAGIQNTLARYRQAFNALSASAAREIWPTVNERSLSRAFDRLEEQQVSFDGCNIQVSENDRAEAVCSGSARYVPRVGSRTPRTEHREWHFNLVKQRDEWLIGAVDTR